MKSRFSTFNLHEAHRYDAIKRCIYCGDDSSPLTDEHPFPLGMGGKHVLPKACCALCQIQIGRVEAYCMRDVMGLARAHQNIGSKRRHKPNILRVNMVKDSIVQNVEGSVDELPMFVALPALPHPTELYGEPAIQPAQISVWTYPISDDHPIVTERGAQQLIRKVHVPTWARFIAKIAHAHAISVAGSHTFAPLLQRHILGEEPDYLRYIGGSPSIMRAGDRHFVQLKAVNRRSDDVMLLIAMIRMFGDLGAPLHIAVVGEILDPALLNEMHAAGAVQVA